MSDHTLSLKEAAERAGVSPATLRRWALSGVIPAMSGTRGERWTTPAAAHARVVARLRRRGHSLDHIREAAGEGRLAYGLVEETPRLSWTTPTVASCSTTSSSPLGGL